MLSLCYSTSFKYGWISKKVYKLIYCIHEHLIKLFLALTRRKVAKKAV